MKINMNHVKEKIAGFIFDLIIESGSKSKFFRKYTNHRFRKQYERLTGNADDRMYKRNRYLEKENRELREEINTLKRRLRVAYNKIKVVATEYHKNIPCPHGEKDEENHEPVRTDSIKCCFCPCFVDRLPENGTIICWYKNIEKSEDLENEKE